MTRIWYLCVTETGPALAYTEKERAESYKEKQEFEVEIVKVKEDETD